MDYSAGHAYLAGSNVLIEKGPNQGLFFVRSVPKVVDSISVFINEIALKAQSEFWKAQKEHVPNVFSALSPCTRDFVAGSAVRNRILEHEGLAFQSGSHTQRYRIAARSRIGPAVEAIVGSDSTFTASWSAAMEPHRLAIRAASKLADTNSPVVYGCNFNFVY